MPLIIGTRLGPYEVLSSLGAGGMGEVYKARDTKLNRDVALKILPEAFALDSDRLARFKREAQLLASLNHPNIAAIYGFEESNGLQALVLELVEGPTLAQRIAEGPMAIDEALPIAKQIADALEAAHEQGIIHRDLKPANIKVRSDGVVKVLDFGLAKALEPAPLASDLSQLPTVTSPAMTRMGVILGTAAYMAPEQARGKQVDKRADIWAFGCVLFEMLSGTRAFEGDDVTDFVLAVMTKEPNWSVLPARTPANVRRLLRRCVAKDPKQRLRDIGDMRVELENPEPGNDIDAGLAKQPVWRYARTSTMAAALFAALAFVFAALYFRQAPIAPHLAKLQLVPPEKSTFGAIAVSPDGQRIAFTATGPSGKAQLWVRLLDSVTAQPLPGTDGASYPFWSPDSRFVGFFADSKLKKIEASAGSLQTICDLINDRGGARGGTWNREGMILFAVEPWGPEPLYQVSAAGGDPTPVPVAALEPSGQQNHHHWPSFLPDGRHFLYFAANNTNPERTGIYLASLDSQDARLLIRAETNAAYVVRPPSAPPGTDYIFFVRERTLMAQPFNRQRLETAGDAIPIAEQVGVSSPIGTLHSEFSVSENGVLVYGAGSAGQQLFWFDRAGKQLASLGSPGLYIDFRISPDGRQVAAQREDGRGGADIWLLESSRGTSLRFTSEPAYDAAPVWSPDGTRIGFFSIRDGRWQLWEKPSSAGSDEKLLLKTNADLVTHDWSPDGRFLLYGNIDPKNRKADLWVLLMRSATAELTKSTPFVHTAFDENMARFSPDGRWIAYQSDESGRYEVYLRPLGPEGTVAAGKWQISTNGGVRSK